MPPKRRQTKNSAGAATKGKTGPGKPAPAKTAPAKKPAGVKKPAATSRRPATTHPSTRTLRPRNAAARVGPVVEEDTEEAGDEESIGEDGAAPPAPADKEVDEDEDAGVRPPVTSGAETRASPPSEDDDDPPIGRPGAWLRGRKRKISRPDDGDVDEPGDPRPSRL